MGPGSIDCGVVGKGGDLDSFGGFRQRRHVSVEERRRENASLGDSGAHFAKLGFGVAEFDIGLSPAEVGREPALDDPRKTR